MWLPGFEQPWLLTPSDASLHASAVCMLRRELLCAGGPRRPEAKLGSLTRKTPTVTLARPKLAKLGAEHARFSGKIPHA